MSRIAYVNGRYLRHAEAAVHIEDRGFQLADGVYEVIGVHAGRMIDLEAHMDRLDRSLCEMSLPWPMKRRPMTMVLERMIRLNGIGSGRLYLQVTRGAAPRNHPFPVPPVPPTLVMTAKATTPFDPARQLRPAKVVTIPDERWARCDIKSVALLANVLGRQRAAALGADEAWMVDRDGYVTEGTASNAWIVTAYGALVTRSLSHAILAGVTRGAVLAMARDNDVPLEIRAFTVEEAKMSREAFLTSTSNFVKPVGTIDDATIGDGGPGPLSRDLIDWFASHLAALARGEEGA